MTLVKIRRTLPLAQHAAFMALQKIRRTLSFSADRCLHGAAKAGTHLDSPMAPAQFFFFKH
jgi:hypothetical protein